MGLKVVRSQSGPTFSGHNFSGPNFSGPLKQLLKKIVVSNPCIEKTQIK
jgi:hypothetical protein